MEPSKQKLSPLITFNNGLKMPIIGLGTSHIGDDDRKKIEQSIEWAYEAGYRSLDTAKYYENEKEIGDAIKKLKIKREDIFITTKIWYTDYDDPEK